MVWKPSQKVWDQGVSAIPVRQIETTLHLLSCRIALSGFEKVEIRIGHLSQIAL